MKDQILKGYVDDFCNSFSINHLDESTCFEHFVNFCVVSKKYPRDFDFENIHVGGSDDIGLDGVAFIVNGNIVKAPEEIEYLIKKNNYLNVSFIFIQTKKSSKFKGDQVGNFIFGIKSFFDDNPSIPENDEISNLRRIKNEIYKNSMSLDDTPPLEIYFVTTGNWKEPEQIQGRVNREIKDLEKSKLFSSIEFNFIDAEKLKQAYREINRKTIKELYFPNHVTLPDIPGIRQAFIGSIPAKDYVDLISDDEGKLQKYLFDDNVRDYQGSNKVNREIQRTINSPTEQASLSVFNNGITIIAKKIDTIGKKLKLTDFQVVNGCQTSHVLYENRVKLLSDTNIVVKIIETTDYDFATKVVKATNRQTEVKDEAFESLRQFHRDLEEFYKSKASSTTNPIYYERRSRQYYFAPGVKQNQVVSLSTQINSFVATHLAQPQSTHRYYGELLDSNRDKMFKEGDILEPYYLSALLLKRLEFNFAKGNISAKLKPFKFHIIFLCYQFYLAKKSLKKEYQFSGIETDINNHSTSIKVFKAAAVSIENCLKNYKGPEHEASRSKVFTDHLVDELQKQIPEINVTSQSSGQRERRRR